MKTIKLLLTTIAVLLCSLMANAYDFYVDGIYYNITSSTYLKVEVTYVCKGAWVSYVSNYSGAVIIPSTVAYEGSTYSVTSIGEGAFYDCDGLTSVTIPNSVTSIGESAFYDCNSLNSITIGQRVKSIGWSAFAYTNLNSVTLPSSLELIEEYAFYDCKALYDIYCYAKMPPAISESSFVNYNAYVHVPCDSKRYYQADMVWSLFPNIQCIESDEVKTDGVVVTPSTNDVTIIWPTSDSADTYTIIIKQGNDVFCTLTFNADGQLLNIAFAPSRDGDNRPAQYAEQAVNGYRFTVTGLTEATQYAYSVTTKDAANQTIVTYSGEFTTMGGTTSAIEDIWQNTTNVQKLIRNGQLLILREGKTYNIMGQEI